MNRKKKPASGSARKQPRKKITAVWLFVFSLLFAEILFYSWCRVQNMKAGYEIDVETKKLQTLLKEQRNLKIEYAVLKAPDRIARIAGKKLGLIMPRPDQTVVVP